MGAIALLELKAHQISQPGLSFEQDHFKISWRKGKAYVKKRIRRISTVCGVYYTLCVVMQLQYTTYYCRHYLFWLYSMYNISHENQEGEGGERAEGKGGEGGTTVIDVALHKRRSRHAVFLCFLAAGRFNGKLFKAKN